MNLLFVFRRALLRVFMHRTNPYQARCIQDRIGDSHSFRELVANAAGSVAHASDGRVRDREAFCDAWHAPVLIHVVLPVTPSVHGTFNYAFCVTGDYAYRVVIVQAVPIFCECFSRHVVCRSI